MRCPPQRLSRSATGARSRSGRRMGRPAEAGRPGCCQDRRRPPRTERAAAAFRRPGRGSRPRNGVPPGEADRMDRVRRWSAALSALGRGGPPDLLTARSRAVARPRRRHSGATPRAASRSAPSTSAGAASATPTSHSPATAPATTAPSASAARIRPEPELGSAGPIERAASRSRSSISTVSSSTIAGCPTPAAATAPPAAMRPRRRLSRPCAP